MARFIDADALPVCNEYVDGDGEYVDIVYKRDLDAAPTIDPVKRARWDINKSPSGMVTHRCTNCRSEPPRRSWRAKPYAFCPDCGARMDLEEENDG